MAPSTASHNEDLPNDEVNRYRCLSWDNAIHTFGTSFIFQQRARKFKKRLLLVNYIGLGVPLILGTLVLTFGIFDGLKMVVIIAGIILIPQVAINLWAIMGGWVESHSYANASSTANDFLSNKYRELGANPPNGLQDLKHEYDKLQIEDQSRRDQDLKFDITEAERRMGMRAALRKFQRPCAACKLIPTSLIPTECDVCGKYQYKEK